MTANIIITNITTSLRSVGYKHFFKAVKLKKPLRLTTLKDFKLIAVLKRRIHFPARGADHTSKLSNLR